MRHDQDPSAPTPAPARAGPLRRLARSTLLFIILGTCLIAIGSCMNIGERLFYFPSRATDPTPRAYEDVTFTTTDNLTLHGWFIPAASNKARAPVIVHAHGNAGNVANHHEMSAFLASRDFHVLVFDYRSYGRSDQAPLSRRALIDDTHAAVAYARTRADVDPDRVALLGISLGAQPALAVAADDPGIACVATLSAFSTWRAVAHDHIPLLGPALVGPGRNAKTDIAKLTAPLWIGHGRADTIVPPRHATILQNAALAAGVNTTIRLYDDADHNTIIFTHPQCREDLARFFAHHLLGDPPPEP